MAGPLDDPDLVLRFWKPHGVMTAFTDRDGRATLADFIDVPGVFAGGRLDRDSEGLLLLTRGKRLRTELMRPDIGHPRSYLVQVEGIPSDDELFHLASGVDLKDGRSRPATAERLEVAPTLPDRDPPIRVRKTVPDSWIRLTLTEGKNRQVRRMTAAVGHPTLRLVRERIGAVTLDGLAPGEWEVLDRTERGELDATLRAAAGPSQPARGRRRRGPRSRG
ncbi:MAG: pseudouridine synthase [Acidimicrobiales bacterium]|nr:pseudouridine synthase [Acidimicrobiales bacterium]